MIKPSKIKGISQKFADQNMKFRLFLKGHVDADELDEHFLRLHDELFSAYDCCKCNNCCKSYSTILTKNDVSVISKFLGEPKSDFIAKYLNTADEGYEIKDKPCCFLNDNGKCEIQECKPAACREFPHTNKPDRLFSLLGIMESAEICPVVFEIIERLKLIYNFKTRN